MSLLFEDIKDNLNAMLHCIVTILNATLHCIVTITNTQKRGTFTMLLKPDIFRDRCRVVDFFFRKFGKQINHAK